MTGWKEYEGKKVFIQLKTGRFYSGTVIEIDESSLPIIFISIIDKFNNRVTLAQSEIITIQVESK